MAEKVQETTCITCSKNLRCTKHCPEEKCNAKTMKERWQSVRMDVKCTFSKKARQERQALRELEVQMNRDPTYKTCTGCSIVDIPVKRNYKEYTLEILKLLLSCCNFIFDGITCVMQIILRSLMTIFLLVQAVISNTIRSIYNLIAFCIQLMTLIPCIICYSCITLCKRAMCNACCIYQKIQVIILTVPVIILFIWILNVTGLLDIILKQFNYERAPKPGLRAFKLPPKFLINTQPYNIPTDLSIPQDIHLPTHLRRFQDSFSTLKPYMESSSNKYGDFAYPGNLDDVTDDDSNLGDANNGIEIFEIETTNKITIGDGAAVTTEISETVTQNQILKDIPIYDTVIENESTTVTTDSDNKIDATTDSDNKIDATTDSDNKIDAITETYIKVTETTTKKKKYLTPIEEIYIAPPRKFEKVYTSAVDSTFTTTTSKTVTTTPTLLPLVYSIMQKAEPEHTVSFLPLVYSILGNREIETTTTPDESTQTFYILYNPTTDLETFGETTNSFENESLQNFIITENSQTYYTEGSPQVFIEVTERPTETARYFMRITSQSPIVMIEDFGVTERSLVTLTDFGETKRHFVPVTEFGETELRFEPITESSTVKQKKPFFIETLTEIESVENSTYPTEDFIILEDTTLEQEVQIFKAEDTEKPGVIVYDETTQKSETFNEIVVTVKDFET